MLPTAAAWPSVDAFLLTLLLLHAGSFGFVFAGIRSAVACLDAGHEVAQFFALMGTPAASQANLLDSLAAGWVVACAGCVFGRSRTTDCRFGSTSQRQTSAHNLLKFDAYRTAWGMLRSGIGAGCRCLTTGVAGGSTNVGTLRATAHRTGCVGSSLLMVFWKLVLPVRVGLSCGRAQEFEDGLCSSHADDLPALRHACLTCCNAVSSVLLLASVYGAAARLH